MQGVQVHSLQTPLWETKPLLFIRLQNGAARGRLVSRKAGRRGRCFLVCQGRRLESWACAAARVEDERDLGFTSTYCVWQAKYRLDQVELLISRWHAILYPPPTPHLPRIDHFRSHIILNCAHSFSRPTFFLFFLPLHYCNGLEPDPALILLLFKAFSSLSWAIFHYPRPSLIDSINAIWLFFPLWIAKNGKKKAVFNNPAHTVIQLIFILLYRSEIAFCTYSKSFHLIMHSDRCPCSSNIGLHGKLLMWTLNQSFISVFTRVYDIAVAICLLFWHFSPSK